MKYLGVNLEGEIDVDNSNAKFTSTDLDNILEEIYTARSGGGGGASDDEWILHEAFSFTASSEHNLPANYTDIRFVILENIAGVAWDSYFGQEISALEMAEMVALGYSETGWHLHLVITDDSGNNVDMQLDYETQTYYIMSADLDNIFLCFYKNNV